MARPRRFRRAVRLLAVLILAVMCWIAVWWRPVQPAPASKITIAAERLAVPSGIRIGPFAVTGAWRLHADGVGFDSLSALAVARDGRFFALSDRSRWYRFPKPGASAPTTSGHIDLDFGHSSVSMGDTESLVLDRESGRWWTSIENFRGIARFDADGTSHYIQPAMMQAWPTNQGAEAMVRLADGRFVVFAEAVSAGRDGTHAALLFAGDPIESGDPFPLHLDMPGGVRPVEAALLPDGRVLILGRGLGLPTGFKTTLAIADPRDIRIGGVWPAKELGRLRGWSLSDNYEGMAVETGRNGALTVWLVSDDNQAKRLQQTLLLRLDVKTGAL